MMWKDDIQDQIEECEYNIRFARRQKQEADRSYWDGYIVHENEILEALKALLPKAPDAPYSVIPVEREKKIRIGGYAW